MFLQACDPSGVHVQSIEISPSEYSLTKGKTLSLKAIFTPSTTSNKGINWTSSNENVATVDDKGVVTGISIDEVTITGTTVDGNKTATAKIKVIAVIYKIDFFSLSPPQLNLDISNKYTKTSVISVNITPPDARPKVLKWVSSMPEVASINEQGLATGLSAGTTTIRVSTIDEINYATCEVTVTGEYIPLTKIELIPQTITIEERNSMTLSIKFTPENATDVGVNWTSIQTNRIISLQGSTITGQSPGQATVVVTSIENSDISATCLVTITKKIVSVASVNLSPTVLDISLNQSSTLVAMIFPEDATDKSVRWTSTPANIVNVVDGVVTGIGVGRTTVAVITNDGNLSSVCDVNVNPIGIKVTAVSISPNTVTVATDKESSYITANLLPTNASNKKVTWTSSNSTIVTVTPSQIGTSASIQGKEDGTAIITVTTDDGNFTATCTVTSKTKLNIPNIQLYSNSFTSNGPIPVKFTNEGANMSPRLSWNNPGEGIGSYVIVLIEENANAFNILFTYTVPDNATLSLDEGAIPNYVGPNPNANQKLTYSFKLYVMKSSTTFVTTAGASHELLQFNNQDNLLFVSNSWVGTYTGTN